MPLFNLKKIFDGDILLSGEIMRIFVGGYFGGRALFGALIPLAALFADLLYADLRTEKGRIAEKPHGH